METKASTQKASHSIRTQRIFTCILFVAAFAEFVVRGPIRNLHTTTWSDLAQFYVASRLWLRGQNFASADNFVALWHNEVGPRLSSHAIRTHLAPPPGSLVLYAPIAALPWPWAKLAWLAVLLAAFAATVWALVKTAGFRVSEPRTLAFIAGCCALAPFHTGLAGGNGTILVAGLCALGVWAATGRRDIMAGLLFGAACSLKPHIGSFLVLYYLVRRRWRLFGTAIALTGVLALLALLWMQIKGVTWAPDYFHNMRMMATQNTIDDFTSANPIRFMLINLQVLFYSFTRSARESNILAFVSGAFLIAVWIYLVLRNRSEKSELLALSAIAVIGLLPVYHRLYDATLLAIPLCWCVSEVAGKRKNIVTISLLLMVPFLVPGTAVLQQLALEHKVSSAWTQSWWWERVIMPHQTWLLLLLAIILLYALARERPGDVEA